MSNRPDNEMEQIHRGLENFLEQELQLYTIEDEKKQEKELDIIGAAQEGKSGGNRQKTASRRKKEEVYQFYEEDWDRPRESGRNGSGSTAQGRRGNTGQERGGNGNTGGSKGSDSRGAGNNGGSRNTGGPKGSDSRGAGGNSSSRNGRKPQGAASSKAPRGTRSSDSGSSAGDQEWESRVTNSRASRTKDKKSRSSSKAARSQDKTKNKKKSRFKRFLIIAALVAAVFFFGLYQLVGLVYNKLNYTRVESVAGQPMQKDGVVNILLIGNDSRVNGEDGRSDAMILLSISKRTKTIYMTSLLRDMYVEIPGRNSNRLNAAYSYGGAELLMETVEQNLGITVNRYVQVNFEAFANLVEAVDGVDLELTTAEIEYVNGYLVEYNMLTDRPQGTDNMDPSLSGMVHLNGPQALAYCRNRYIGTDFGRTERQRKVLTEVIKKLPRAALTNGGELIDGLMPNLTTNLTQWECFRLSLMAGRLLTYDIVSDNIPQPGTYSNATIRQMSVLQVDFEANRKYLREKIYGETFD